MSANRLPAPWGSRIDRSKTVSFSFDGKTVTQNHVISVSVVDTTNVGDFTGFGDAVAK